MGWDIRELAAKAGVTANEGALIETKLIDDKDCSAPAAGDCAGRSCGIVGRGMSVR